MPQGGRASAQSTKKVAKSDLFYYNVLMDLYQEVTAIKGIGEKTAESLKKSGIITVRDLLYFLPRDYENYQTAVKIADLKPGKVIIKGKIADLKTVYTRRRNFTITSGTIADETGSIKAVWFNQPYRVKQFDEKKEYYFTGEYAFKANKYQLQNPSAILAEDVAAETSHLHPVYPQRSGVKSQQFVKFFDRLRPQFNQIPDLLPLENAPSFVRPAARKDALYSAHFPDTEREAEAARKYLAYEELLGLILASALSKAAAKKLRAAPLKFEAKNTKALLKTLPFTLTDAQKRATWDILQDLEKTTPMSRLLQGDVGSGKTVVAAIAAFQAIKSGAQVALIAPTSILATQHAEGLDKILSPLGVKTALLIGATKHKETVKEQIATGTADLIIGTHAILTDDTIFHNLALCIIDEQHRFGVKQRQKLLLKTPRNLAPHLLSMTATPIPRSLQLTVFGDLDMSTISELPKGRQKIETKVIKETDKKATLYPKIHQEIAKNHQIYWICRAIEDTGTSSEVASVKRQAKKLQELFQKQRIEFLHGKMKPAEKDEIMSKFAAGKIDILVSTTVVEVGVNVPNATVMVIEDAENYGLAQLHQLRGRVGRGQDQSYCYLISKADQPTRRLKAMEATDSGFKLAELDLRLRGPGEIYGSLQHGALDLNIASFSDTALIAAARKQVAAIVKNLEQDPAYLTNYQELSAGIFHYQKLTILN